MARPRDIRWHGTTTSGGGGGRRRAHRRHVLRSPQRRRAKSERDMIVVVNDNEMSISKNVGALSRYLTGHAPDPVSIAPSRRNVRRSGLERMCRLVGPVAVPYDRKIPGYGSRRRVWIGDSIFDALGFRYIGPVDGHDIQPADPRHSAAPDRTRRPGGDSRGHHRRARAMCPGGKAAGSVPRPVAL